MVENLNNVIIVFIGQKVKNKKDWQPWKENELEFLKNNYKQYTRKELGILLGGRSKNAVQQQLCFLNLTRPCSPVIPGEKFFRLTVIKITDIYKNDRRYWECKCDCGNTTLAYGSKLRSGELKSCGCLHLERIRKPVGEGQLNRFERSYKNGAKIRNIEYNLETYQFRQIIKQNCHYCNSEPMPRNDLCNSTTRKKYSYKDNSSEWCEQQWVNVNGIDRKDNTIGYNLNNCLPCCINCNKMKLTLGYDEFLKHIEKIYNFKIKNV